jgi:hypothetical protein
MTDKTQPNNHFNRLTPAEDERLALVSEECAEVIQIICKIQRHGYESYHPDDDNMNNRGLLTKELGDLRHVIERLEVADLTPRDIEFWKDEKAKKIVRYLHHQPDGEGEKS